MLAGKTLLDYTNLFSLNDYKTNYKIIKINMVEEASIEFRLRKIDEIRNYLLDEIKHNDLMSVRTYKKTCKYLNNVENLHILASTVTG